MASLIGKEIGKYRITERLGQGGMAEVYAGIHTHLDRKVAVKVLHSYLLEGGDFVARFKREAKAVANLRHPNIVQVFDFDIQEGLIFMVMEYIDGVNLHTKLIEMGNKGERMPIKMIGSIINDIASALDYAHSKGMLHRDIKPSNIMIDSDNKAYLTDFGIAKLLSDQKFTATGTLVGTPAYMSPEQGRGDDLTEESDIYSLGVVAFEMLTGQVPYDAKTPIGIVHKQINDPVPTISELVDGVPSTAQEVIDRALAKSPEGRFSSAVELVGALRTALQALESTDPIVVPPKDTPAVDDRLEAPTVAIEADDLEQPTVVMQDEKPIETAAAEDKSKQEPLAEAPQEKKRIPVWVYIAGAVALLAVAGVVLTQVLGIGQPRSGSSSDLAPGAVEVWLIADQESEGIMNVATAEDADYELIQIDGDWAWQTGSGSSIETEGGNRIPDYYLVFNIADSQIFELPPGSDVYLDVTYLDQGQDEFMIQYDSHDLEDDQEGMFKNTNSLTKNDTGQFLTARFILVNPLFINRTADGDFRLDDRNDGPEVIREVRVVWIPPEQEQVEQSHTDAGETAGEENNGEELYNQALAFFEEGNIPESINFSYMAIDAGFETADVYQLIGRSHRRLEEFEAALEPLNRAIEMDPNHYWARYNRGVIRYELKDFGGAIEDLVIAAEIDPDMWHTWHYLGASYYFSGDDNLKDEAFAAFDRAIEIQPENFESYILRGQLRWYRFGDWEGAVEDLTAAIELNPDDPTPWNWRGVVYLETGQWELCIPDYSEFIARDPENPWAYKERGDCYRGLDDFNAARADYEQFMALSEGDPDLDGIRSDIQAWMENNQD